MPAPITGQVTLSGTAQSCDSTGRANPIAWTLKVPRGNAHNVFVGPAGVTTSTGHVLEPGDSMDFEQRNKSGENIYQLRPGDVYVVGTTGEGVSWFGSP